MQHEHHFSPATPYEQSLVTRQQLMHVATEIFKSGIDKGRFMISEEDAAQRAWLLIQEVDRIVVKCRTTPEEEEE